MPGLLQGPGLPWWPHGKGRDQSIVRRSRQVVRQMPQRQVDHVAVVRVFFARCLRQVEPEAMDELNIVLSEMGSVRPEVKDMRLAVRRNDAIAELTPWPIRHLPPDAAEPSGLLRWRQHRGASSHDLDGTQLRRGEDCGLEDIRRGDNEQRYVLVDFFRERDDTTE